MMSLESIRHESLQATKKAARKHLEPYVPHTEEEIESYPPFPFPNLGDHVPKGWKLVETLFCDSSGFGASDEPALTVAQLKRELITLQRKESTYGYGIVEIGQFQLHLGIFKRCKHKSLGDNGASQG